MSDIQEYQRRITAALDRIAQELDIRPDTGAAVAELARLRQELEDEKLANGQLQERVKSMRDKQNALEDELISVREQNSAALSTLDKQLQSLRRANDQLRDNNMALRQANAAGVGEAHLINKSMMAELESLRAVRSADQAETSAILSELSTVIDNVITNDASEPEDA